MLIFILTSLHINILQYRVFNFAKKEEKTILRCYRLRNFKFCPDFDMPKHITVILFQTQSVTNIAL